MRIGADRHAASIVRRPELAISAWSARKAMNIGPVVRPWFEELKRLAPVKR
jgi:hypothetical protein